MKLRTWSGSHVDASLWRRVLLGHLRHQSRKIVSALLVTCACYTAPVVQTSDTSAQQEQIRKVQTELVRIPDAPGNQIAPRDRATIYQAGDALSICGESLQKLDGKLNKCAAEANECGTRYRSLSADLTLCEAQNSFFGNLWRDLKVLALGGVIGALLALFGPALLGFILKATARIP